METHTKRKKIRTRDRVKNQLHKVSYLDNPRKVNPLMYYVWQYYREEDRKSIKVVSEKLLYRKHICAIPFLSRYHARDMIRYMFGNSILDYHIIKGRKLIQQGITTIDGNKSHLFQIRGDDGWHKLKRFRYTIEGKTHTNLEEFKKSLYNFFLNHTKKEFNDHYKAIYMGERIGIDKSIRSKRYIKISSTLDHIESHKKSLSDQDLEDLQIKMDNYKSLIINPKEYE